MTGPTKFNDSNLSCISRIMSVDLSEHTVSEKDDNSEARFRLIIAFKEYEGSADLRVLLNEGCYNLFLISLK